jgi:hypothetical protein
MGKVHLGALLRHMHVPPASLRFDKEQEIPCAIAFVLVIKALWLSCLRWQRDAGLFDQLSLFLDSGVLCSNVVQESQCIFKSIEK